MKQTIAEIVQKMETEYIRGSAQISEHVDHSLKDTIDRIEAYLNSKHISGETDSQGRLKPFFNIVVALANIWMRATDIDRKHIRLSARNSKNWLDSFFANVLLQDWMRREFFGQFLNEWGRVLSRYGSAIVKFVENSSGLHISVVPWNRSIVDAISFDPNPKIEILELTEGELRKRIDTHGYDADQVEALLSAKTARDTLGKQKKDNKSDYIKLYETHGYFQRSQITDDPNDDKIYEYQMHVISFVAGKKRGDEDLTFTVYKGVEKEDPYMLTHLIKEDGRTLSIGPVEYAFDAQWMVNHSLKAEKDYLDIASKLVFQTADANFVGRNVLTAVENGDVLVTLANMPITQVATATNNPVAWSNYAVAWRDVGREMTGVSEAMLGQAPKAGTAWRQLETQLTESYSLFELMTENKGNYLEQMLRERILPYLFKKYKNVKEVSAFLEKHDLTRLDRMYIKAEATRRTNKAILDNLEKQLTDETEEIITPEMQLQMQSEEETGLQETLGQLGNQRFVEPSDVDWQKQFKDVEWDIDIDITGEEYNPQEIFSTINTALKLILTPGFDQNAKAQALVGRVLDLTGAISAIEWGALPASAAPAQGGGSSGAEFTPPTNARNINAKA